MLTIMFVYHSERADISIPTLAAFTLPSPFVNKTANVTANTYLCQVVKDVVLIDWLRAANHPNEVFRVVQLHNPQFDLVFQIVKHITEVVGWPISFVGILLWVFVQIGFNLFH